MSEMERDRKRERVKVTRRKVEKEILKYFKFIE
jgi:hypothetical protein